MKYILILLLLTACAETSKPLQCIPEEVKEITTFAYQIFPDEKYKINKKDLEAIICKRKDDEQKKGEKQ